MSYELSLENFSGPIDKLLELIEEKQLEITEVSLAEITSDFLDYLKKIEDVKPRFLADFVAIASHLLLVKSKALLPGLQLSSEEESNIKDLESRLHFYREFKPAMNHLKKLWERNESSISRTFLSGLPTVFYPAENVSVAELRGRIKEIFDALRQFSEKTQTVKTTLVTLEEKVEEIMKRMEKDLSFGKLAKDKDRAEVIVLFLALLHLLARQSVKVEQKSKFSDIMISK